MAASLPPPVYRLFVGVDIAAVTATVAWLLPGTPITRPITIDQTPSGLAQLQARLQATGIAPGDTLVVLEATGSYWITLATALHQAGYAVSVINPMQAHHFAKALLKNGDKAGARRELEKLKLAQASPIRADAEKLLSGL